MLLFFRNWWSYHFFLKDVIVYLILKRLSIASFVLCTILLVSLLEHDCHSGTVLMAEVKFPDGVACFCTWLLKGSPANILIPLDFSVCFWYHKSLYPSGLASRFGSGRQDFPKVFLYSWVISIGILGEHRPCNWAVLRPGVSLFSSLSFTWDY